MSLIGSITDPNIAKHLLREEGEVIVDEVLRHWAAYIRPSIEAVLAIALLVITPFISVDLASVPLIVRVRAARSRRLVRWCARSGTGSSSRTCGCSACTACSPATWRRCRSARILDITVVKPLHGRMLGFGHFVFESAAQEQGLRDIRYVGRPDERDLTIQRVVQRSGLRGPRIVN